MRARVNLYKDEAAVAQAQVRGLCRGVPTVVCRVARTCTVHSGAGGAPCLSVSLHCRGGLWHGRVCCTVGGNIAGRDRAVCALCVCVCRRPWRLGSSSLHGLRAWTAWTTKTRMTTTTCPRCDIHKAPCPARCMDGSTTWMCEVHGASHVPPVPRPCVRTLLGGPQQHNTWGAAAWPHTF